MGRLALSAFLSVLFVFLSVQEAAALKLSFEFHGTDNSAVRLRAENRVQDRQRDFASSVEACLRNISEELQQKSCQNFYQIMAPALAHAVDQVAEALLTHPEETKDVVLCFSFTAKERGLPQLQVTLLHETQTIPVRSILVMQEFATLVPANQLVLVVEGINLPVSIRFAAIDPLQMLSDGRAFPHLLWPRLRVR